VREWLEQQAVAGFLTFDAPDADPAARRYHLPDAYRQVLVDEADLSNSPLWAAIAIARAFPDVSVDALAVLPADPVIGSPPCNTRGS
jgi:hypothetical protein